MEKNKIYLGDCLELIPKHVEDKSIDMIFCDLPYGTTANKWDSVIPLGELWKEYKRVLTESGCVLLFSSQPFTTSLINSNFNWFKYELIWNKLHGTDFQLANKKPMKAHENILLFAPNKVTYNKQMTKRDKPINTKGWKQNKRNKDHNNFNSKENIKKVYDYKNPTSVIEYSLSNGECNNTKRVHPTQKPLFLIEWFIKTYTNEGNLILDNTCGSGTTGRGAKNLNRDYIMMEQDETYYELACKRLED